MYTFDETPDPEAARVWEAAPPPRGEPGPGDRVRAICREMARIAGQISAGSFRLLDLIARFESLGGGGYVNARSTAHFLAWQCGLDLRTAREHVRVARALKKLPRVAGALRAGEISYSKVRVLTRVASPADEGFFLNIARSGSATHLERIVRLSRRHVDPAQDRADASRSYFERGLRCRWERDGSLHFEGTLPPEEGALLLRALQAAWDELAADASRESGGVSRSVKQNAPAGASGAPSRRRIDKVDALATIAESFLANGLAALTGAERYQVFVHVKEPTQGDGQPPRHELDGEVALPAAVARRITCDCSKLCVHEGARGQPLSVGRRTRQIPTPMRRALEVRDRGCRFPGCTNRRFVDAHHVRHWADGGETRLDNLVLLCRHHHRVVHEGGWSIESTEGGEILFADASGRIWPRAPAPPRRRGDPIAELDRDNRATGVTVDHRTIIPRWGGLDGRVDYDMALQSLADRRRDARSKTRLPS